MDWNRLTVSGRVTALQRGICAGVSAESAVFVAHLRWPQPRVTTYDDMLVDSFGVLGVAPGAPTWLSGRGADGSLQLWEAAEGDPRLRASSLADIDAMWAAPALDAGSELLLSGHLVDGSWRLRVHGARAATVGETLEIPDLSLGSAPDSTLVVGCPEKEPLVVAGLVGDFGQPTAMALSDGGWRRIHLSPTPSALTSVAYAAGGRRTWIGGVAEGRVSVHELLPLRVRGPLRTAPVALPRIEVDPQPSAGGHAVLIVDDTAGELPVLVAATARGNRLCWHDGREWVALAAPDGALRAACASGDGIHALIGADVWSIQDPTTA